jgi:hypothetical protein
MSAAVVADSSNVIASVVAALVTGISVTVAGRFGLAQKKLEITHEDERHAEDLSSKNLSDLLVAQAKFASDLREEREDLTKHIVDLQNSRQKLWKDIDDLHRLRIEENQANRKLLEECERRSTESERKSAESERKSAECEERVEKLAARVAVLERRRRQPSGDDFKDG